MGDGSRAEVAQLARGVVEGGVAQLGPDCEKKKKIPSLKCLMHVVNLLPE